MGQPYIGEVRIFAGNFAPMGWMFCEGQILPISENDTLFALLGTTYGGDGQQTFALPDLRGRIPVHQGQGPGLSPRVMAQSGGAETVSITAQQLPAHTHPMLATPGVGSQSNPSNHVLAQGPTIQMYIQDVPDSSFAPSSVSTAGGSQPHSNLMPFLCVNYIISLFGIFPSQN